MNNIYKVIWSKVANALVVVSELARSKGVSGRNSVAASSNTVKVRTKLTALSVALSFCFGASSVFAADINEANVTATTSLTVGANNIGTTTLHGTATLNGKNLATADDLLTKANQSDLNTLKTTVSTKANQSDLTDLTTTVNSKANQSDLTDLKGTVDKLGIQTTYNGIKYFRTNSTGVDASATGTDAVAIGPVAQATEVDTVAIGHEASASKAAAIAVGKKSYSNADNGVAVGNDSTVTAGATSAVALGFHARAGSNKNGDVTYDGADKFLINDGASAVAIGDHAISRGQHNIAIGKNALTTNKDKAGAFSQDSVAIGSGAETIAASSAIALGKGARAGVRGNAEGADSAIAMGDGAQATGLDATAIGHSAQAGKLGLAAGTSAQATGENSVALGSAAQSTSKGSVAIGNGAIAAPYRTISIGQDAGKGQAADLVGDKNEQINIGVKAGENVDGQLNIGIGQAAGSNVQGKGNIALGQNAGQYIGGTNSSVGNNISIGTNANTYTAATDIQESVAIGFGAKAKTRSVALGKETKATELDSVAIGNNATSNGSGSLAIGNDSVVNGADNIALGRSSVADTKAASGYLTSKQSSTVVSVGKSDLLRRIVNVADGADDQDAATVAQLKKVSDEVYNKVNTQINKLSITATSGINYDAVPEDTTKNSVTLSKDGKKTLIRSVAEGTKDDDAVNVSQLKKTVEENKTHYFSTNDGGTTRGNFNNNGAVGNGSLAIGMEVKSLEERGVSLGNHTSAEGVGSIALGTLYKGSAELDDNDAQNAVQTVAKSSTGQPFKYNMAIGAGASSEGNNSLAIGTLATTTTKQQNNSTPDRAVALGYFAKSSAPKANAIGERATATEEKANAFGSQATAAGISATAIGTAALAEGKNSIAMGTHQRVTGENSGSIGYAGDATLSTTGRSLNGTYADIATKVKGAGTYSIGNTNSEITSNESGVFGNNNFVQGKENIRVMGNNNIITKNNQNPQGGPAVAPTLKNVYVTGHANKIDTGAKPLEASKNIFVMGAGNTIGNSQNNATAAQITDSYVIGTGNTVNNPNRTLTGSTANPSFGDDPSDPSTTKSKIGRGYFILGNNVTATLDDSVYLGTNSAYISAADRSAGTQYKKPTDAYEALLFEKYTGHWATGVVTVGSVSSPRRIQGVASGLVGPNSMDAINGSQLYAHTRPVGFVADNTEGLAGKDLDKLVVDEQGITNMVKRSAGQAIKLNGGADKTKLSDNNIGTLVKGTNQVDIKLAKELKGLTSAEFKDGANTTTINGKGVTINNGPSMTTEGINAGNLKVTGVASSIADQVINNNPNPTFIDKLNQANNTNPNNAVNVSDLHNVLSGANGGGFGLKDQDGAEVKQDLGTTVKVKGDTNVYTKVVTDGSGKALEVGLKDTVTLGKAGTDGKDGKIGVNGKDGSAVVINGKDGSIGLNGKDGKDGLTMKSANGKDGVDGLNGTDGKTRLVYEYKDKNNQPVKEEVATLNDGLVFTGNNNTVLNKHKLNTTVNVVGDSSTAELANFASATGNLNVVADGNNKLTVQMNKNLKNLNSVTLENKDDPTKSVTLKADQGGNLDVGGKKITNVAKGTDDTDAVNVSQLKEVAATAGKGWNLTTGGNPSTKHNVKPDGTVDISGDENITVTNPGENGAAASGNVKVGLKPTVTLGEKAVPAANGQPGKDGVDGKLTVNGKDGSAVVINGKDGSIGLNGKDGENGLTMKSAQGKPGVDGKDGETKTRIVYELKDKDGNPVKDKDGNPVKEEVATLNDGLKFGANSGNVHNAKLNSQVDVKGAATNTEWGKFDGGKNIMTNIAGNTITVGLAKDLDVNSVTTGDTKVENDGITIKNGSEQSKTVSLTKTGLNNGGNQVVNMDSGLKDSQGNKVTLTEATGDVLNNGVNVGDLKETVNKLIGPSDIGGFGLKDKAGNEFKQSLGTTAQITGDKNINTKVVDVLDAQGQPTGKKALEVGLNPEVELGKKGNDGVDGKLTVNGKDGSAVVINGKDGSIGLNGKDGENGLTMKSANGKDGVDGANGTNGKTRIVYELKDKDGKPVKGADGKPVTEEVATLNDGLVFAGNNTDKENKHKLNSKVNIVGDSTAEQLKDFKSATGNLNVVADGNNKLTVQMSKNLKNLNSVTLENPTDAKKSVTLTVTDKGELNVGGDKAEGNQVTGVKSSITDKLADNPKATFADKLKNAANKDNGNPNNAVNVGDLYNVFSGESGGGFGLKDKAGNEFKQDLGTAAQITGDKNINTKVIDVLDGQGQPTGKKALEVGLNPEVELGKKGDDGVDGKIGVNGKDGSAVVINGKDGSIGLNGKDGKDGLTMKSAQGKPGVDGKDGETKTRIVYELKDKDGKPVKGADGKPVTEEVATLNDGLKFGANSGDVHNAKLNSQVDVKGHKDNTKWDKFDGGKNIMTQINGNTITVGLANDINVNSVTTNKVTVGDTTITSDGVTINNGPSMTKSGGINANNTTIKNVAPGVNSTDAVNVSQLRTVEGKLHRADRHLRAGIAGANAAAGLPQAYLPGKSMVAVSAGTYRGEGAVALGMSRISDNGKVVVKITGNSDTRGNLGASLGAGYQW
ncbi:hypothetical protein DPV96_08940 [Aggregatibacter segnis]|uniref:YadA-like family protein n=1 Tax=Aggregatibacter segnis TaxID=739 RepID=UPI000DAE5CFA|nr:YadA-like family protein [Aggregatibacter segnis]RDE66268.1 hypothetical protein DPV96_08940 [Aggregatibacter segnis]